MKLTTAFSSAPLLMPGVYDRALSAIVVNNVGVFFERIIWECFYGRHRVTRILLDYDTKLDDAAFI